MTRSCNLGLIMILVVFSDCSLPVLSPSSFSCLQTFEIAAKGTVVVTDQAGNTVFSHAVEVGATHSYTPTLLHPYTPTLLHSYNHTLLHSYTPTLLHSYTNTLLNS